MNLSTEELELLASALVALIDQGKREYGPDWVGREMGKRALALRAKVRSAATKSRNAATKARSKEAV